MHSFAGYLSRQRKGCDGFSLYDMLITLGIGSALTVGAVGLRSIVQETNMVTAVNTLMAHLSLARSEAIKRRVEIVVCPTRNGETCNDASADHTWWSAGYLVFADQNDNGERDADEPIIHMESASKSDLAVKTSKHRIKVTYRPSGLAGGSTITFAFCDGRGAEHARYVTIQNAGRARVSRTTASDIRCA